MKAFASGFLKFVEKLINDIYNYGSFLCKG